MIRRSVRLASLAAAGLAAAHGWADVTVEQTTRLEGTGLMAAMNMSVTTTTAIAGDRSRTDSEMKMDSRWMRMFAGGAGNADIVRLDRDMVYQLDTKKKRYSEISLADQRAEIQRSMDQMRDAQESQQQGSSGVDESQCEWSEPETSVERTGAKATVAGYQAEQLSIVASQSCVDRQNPGQVCEFQLTLDQWLSPDVPGGDEMLEYFKAYSAKLGFEVSGSPSFIQRAEGMFGNYQGLWGQMVDAMQEIKGYPVRSSFGLAIGGPQCGDMQDMADANAGSGETPSVSENVGKAIGGSIGGALGGLFGRKKQQEPEAEAAPAASEPVLTPEGLYPIMTVSSEVLSVSTGDVSADQFEVPADYRKAN